MALYRKKKGETMRPSTPPVQNNIGRRCDNQALSKQNRLERHHPVEARNEAQNKVTLMRALNDLARDSGKTMRPSNSPVQNNIGRRCAIQLSCEQKGEDATVTHSVQDKATTIPSSNSLVQNSAWKTIRS